MQEVTTTRTIKVGNIFRIHPTEAFLGVDRGIVEVVDIHIVPALDKECLDEANAMLTGLFGNNPEDSDKEFYQQCVEELMDSPWIEYRYTHFLCRNPEAEIGKSYYFPLDIFSSSITGY